MLEAFLIIQVTTGKNHWGFSFCSGCAVLLEQKLSALMWLSYEYWRRIITGMGYMGRPVGASKLKRTITCYKAHKCFLGKHAQFWEMHCSQWEVFCKYNAIRKLFAALYKPNVQAQLGGMRKWAPVGKRGWHVTQLSNLQVKALMSFFLLTKICLARSLRRRLTRVFHTCIPSFGYQFQSG